MKVYYRFSNGKERPEIKISNTKLNEVGFKVGSNYEIIYKENQIILMIKENISVKK